VIAKRTRYLGELYRNGIWSSFETAFAKELELVAADFSLDFVILPHAAAAAAFAVHARPDSDFDEV
jgi:hypothetical protein